MGDSVDRYRKSVNAYVNGVIDGGIVAGDLIRASAQRFLDDLEHAESRGYYFDWDRAAAMIDVFPTAYRHTTGAYFGKPFDPYDWQLFILANIFGWRRRSDGLRRFRDVFISCARGNGKSPLAAALLLTLFAFDWPTEPRAEVFAVATTRDQAKIVFSECKRMVEQSPDMQKFIQVYKHNLSILKTASKLEPLASDSKNTDGLVIHAVCIDEIHAWREQHRELHEKIITGTMAKRRQPMVITITTAGNDESKLWAEQYRFSRAVVTRQIEADQHFSAIYEINDDSDPLDEAVWPMANPMLLCSDVVKIDGLHSEAEKARTQPETLLRFKRYHCNKFVRSASKLITPEMWNTGAEDVPPIADGAVCYGGFDFGARDDLSALVLAFPLDAVELRGEFRRRYAVKSWFWTPEESGRDLQREPWASWIRNGLLDVTAGNTTDVQQIYDTVAELAEKYSIDILAFDPHNAREFGTRCENELGIVTYPFPQTCAKYHEPTQNLVCALEESRIIHGGHELLGWCCLNMAVREDSRGYKMPAKSLSEDKIDGAVALIMALSQATYAEKPLRSVYEDRGPLLL